MSLDHADGPPLSAIWSRSAMSSAIPVELHSFGRRSASARRLARLWDIVGVEAD